MLLLEHQGKTLLNRFGIATPAGRVVDDTQALRRAMADGRPKVLKAQVASGGRGKAGGIVTVASEAEALTAFERLRHLQIGGQRCEAILVEERATIARERYMAIQIESGRLLLLIAAQGGVDIETITADDPGNVRTIELDALAGPDRSVLEEAFAALDLPPALWPQYAEIARCLHALARGADAATVEINPLVETPDDRLIALDARIFIDETALARQPALADLRPAAAGSDPSLVPKPSFKQSPSGGAIGLIGFGSGLNITFMDWIATLGGQVGVLVDIDAMVTGGHAEAGFAAAFAHMDRDPAVRAVLLCIISCGNKMDDVVRAMIAAIATRPRDAKPLVLHLRGNRMRQAQPLLDAAALANSTSLASAINEVVAAAAERCS